MRCKFGKFRASLVSAAFMFILSPHAWAEPCDTGYMCSSEDDQYMVVLGSCRNENRLSLEAIKVAGAILEIAHLEASFDGDSVLAFQIDIPTGDGSTHTLSAEGLKSADFLKMKDETAMAPAPPHVTHKALMKCVVTD